eukprot:TRINITY_DN12624_c0_g1_i1.p1 TRINITY_DN12624_c0_g1~~TRINITY_DN12624_c0_g1_i1.p1  ORF type:complete len:238 (-),score=14.74 TRINITY_DN12624_c0_g1_i1:91-783(-)
MDFKLVVFVLTLIAANHAYVVIDTYADVNCNTTLIARFISNAPCSGKRAVAQQGICYGNTSIGVNYLWNTDYCSDTTEPTFPAGWQFITLGIERNCNYSADLFFAFGAPQTLENIIMVALGPSGVVASNTSLSCDASGVLTFATCNEYYCYDLTLENNMCILDSTNTTSALQTTCVATPVSTNEPMTSGPASGPVASPVKTPLNAPGTKTSSAASFVFGSVALLSLINLI